MFQVFLNLFSIEEQTRRKYQTLGCLIDGKKEIERVEGYAYVGE